MYGHLSFLHALRSPLPPASQVESVGLCAQQGIGMQTPWAPLDFVAVHLLLSALENLFSSFRCPTAEFPVCLFKSEDTDLWLFLGN